MNLIDYLKDLIHKKIRVDKKDIFFSNTYKGTEGRFFINILDNTFNGDLDLGDPILEQYVLVPISKIQDRLDIILEN